MGAEHYMLKFRMPYIQKDGTYINEKFDTSEFKDKIDDASKKTIKKDEFLSLDGQLYIQVYPTRRSSETRLIGSKHKNGKYKYVNLPKSISQQTTFYNELDDNKEVEAVLSSYLSQDAYEVYLYPKAKENERLAQNVVGIFDQVMGNGIMEDKEKEHKDDLFIAGDPESEELLRYAREHYTTAPTKVQAFIKFVQRSLKHSKDEDEQQDRQIAQLEKEIGILNSKLANNRPINEDSGNGIAQEVIEKLAPAMDNVHKEKVEDYTDEARKLILKTDNPTVREKLIQIFKKGKENPYLQGGIITTVGALLAGGVLNTSQSMGLSPGQTNMVLQAVLNTIIPALVSRVNGKNWEDTVKYTLASAGIGTGIAALTEDYLEEK